MGILILGFQQKSDSETVMQFLDCDYREVTLLAIPIFIK